MYTIRKKFKFEMAHCLETADSQACCHVHGHSYVMEVFISSKQLNNNGMIIDFGTLKHLISEIVNTFDHAIVLCENDKRVADFQKFNDKIVLTNYNPTAENMAADICTAILNNLNKLYNYIEKITVRLHETDTGWAQYSISKNNI